MLANRKYTIGLQILPPCQPLVAKASNLRGHKLRYANLADLVSNLSGHISI